MPEREQYGLIRVGGAHGHDLRQLGELAAAARDAGGKGMVVQCMHSLALGESRVDAELAAAHGIAPDEIGAYNAGKMFSPSEYPRVAQTVSDAGLECYLSVSGLSDVKTVQRACEKDAPVAGVMLESLEHSNPVVADAAMRVANHHGLRFVAELGMKEPDSVPNLVSAADRLELEEIVLLQTVLGKPAQMNDVDFAALPALRSEFANRGVNIISGYSDYLFINDGSVDPYSIGQKAGGALAQWVSVQMRHPDRDSRPEDRAVTPEQCERMLQGVSDAPPEALPEIPADYWSNPTERPSELEWSGGQKCRAVPGERISPYNRLRYAPHDARNNMVSLRDASGPTAAEIAGKSYIVLASNGLSKGQKIGENDVGPARGGRGFGSHISLGVRRPNR